MDFDILEDIQVEIYKILSSRTKRVKMLSLPTECLLAIFSHLPLNDLINASCVCKRFRECAQEIFKWNFARFDMRAFDRHNMSVMKLKQILRIFGENVRFLKIPNDSFEAMAECVDVVRCVADFCSSQLSELSLGSFTINSICVFEMESVLKNLTRLEMLYCYFDGKRTLDQILWTALNLVELEIVFDDNSVEVIFPELPRLKEVCFGEVAQRNIEAVEVMCEANPQITKFYWKFWSPTVTGDILRIMQTNFSATITSLTLEHYELTLEAHMAQPMRRFKSLEVLILKCPRYTDFVKAVGGLDLPIKYLEFSFHGRENITELRAALGKYNHLNHVKILHVIEHDMQPYFLRSQIKNIGKFEIAFYADYPFRPRKICGTMGQREEF